MVINSIAFGTINHSEGMIDSVSEARRACRFLKKSRRKKAGIPTPHPGGSPPAAFAEAEQGVLGLRAALAQRLCRECVEKFKEGAESFTTSAPDDF